MEGCVATDEVDDGRARTSSVVEIGQAVGQTWPEMEKGGGGFRRHAPVAVCSAGCYALVQAKDGAQTCLLVEARDEMNLGCTRVGEADLDIGVRERPNDALGAVHHP